MKFSKNQWIGVATLIGMVVIGVGGWFFNSSRVNQKHSGRGDNVAGNSYKISGDLVLGDKHETNIGNIIFSTTTDQIVEINVEDISSKDFVGIQGRSGLFTKKGDDTKLEIFYSEDVSMRRWSMIEGGLCAYRPVIDTSPVLTGEVRHIRSDKFDDSNVYSAPTSEQITWIIDGVPAGEHTLIIQVKPGNGDRVGDQFYGTLSCKQSKGQITIKEIGEE